MGAANTPPYWIDTLTGTFTVYAGIPFTYDFVAYDAQADAIQFVYSLNPALTVTELPQTGASRILRISSSGLPANALPYTGTIDLFGATGMLRTLQFTSIQLQTGDLQPAIANEPQIEQYLTDDSGGIDNFGGPNWSSFITHLGVLWKSYRDNGIENVGDYIGLAADGVTETPMSGNPFATVAILGTTNVYYPFEANVTRIVQDYVASGQYKGFYLVASAAGMTIQGRLGTTPPMLEVETSNGTVQCPVRCTARWAQRTETTTPRDGRTIVPLSTSRRAFFNFDFSQITGTVISARMLFTALRTSSTAVTLRIFKADPPTFTLGPGAGTIELGLAAELAALNPGLQERDFLAGDPRVFYGGDFTGTTLQLDNTAQSAIAPPHLFYGNVINTISQPAVDRAIGTPGFIPGPAVEIIDDDQAPGTRYWRGQFPITLPTWTGAAGATWKDAFDVFFSWNSTEPDPEGGRIPVGGPTDVYCRAYFYMEPEWLEINEIPKFGIVFDTRFGHWLDAGGWDPDGGNGGEFSDGRRRPDTWGRSSVWFLKSTAASITGQDIRSNFKGVPTLEAGYPYKGLKRIQSYFYNIDNPSQPATWLSENYWNPDSYNGSNPVGTLVPSGLTSPAYPAVTAYGNVRFESYPNLVAATPPYTPILAPGRWYCFEQRVRLNSVVEPFDRYGNGVALHDGLVETWINGVKVESVTGWRWRRHPRIVIRRAAPLMYNGGSSEYCATQQWFRINHVVAATAYIGPRTLPPPLPTIEVEAIANLLANGQWSSQLSTPRLLGAGQINTNIGYQGDGPTGQAVGPGSYPAFYADNTGSNTKNLLFYSGSSHYYNGEVWFLAGTTGWAGGSISAVRYNLESNLFRHWQGQTYQNNAPGTIFQGFGCSHNHEGTCINPATGLIYKDIAPDSVNSILGTFARRLAIWNPTTQTGTTVAGAGSTSGYPSLEFVPGLGAQGSVIQLATGQTTSIRRYDVATGVWSTFSSVQITSDGAPTCPHQGYAYFVNGASNFFRVGSSGALESRASTPVPMNKGHLGGNANVTRMVGLGSYIYAFHSSGNIYRYDPAANTWSGPIGTAPWTSMTGTTFVALEEYGVVMVVRELSLYNCEAQLWKPPL